MLKRLFDIFFSFLGLVILSPLLLIIAVLIFFGSKGGIFYRQIRVGKNGHDFRIFKLRTMYLDADKEGLLTIGNDDIRITRIGYYLRRSKLDELPQLLNILKGDMSFVGPRPEVRKYVNLYNNEQKKVLNMKPGITDYASIAYSNESEVLKKYKNPEEAYIKEIMPKKLTVNLSYISKNNLLIDLKIIILTFLRIFIVRNKKGVSNK